MNFYCNMDIKFVEFAKKKMNNSSVLPFTFLWHRIVSVSAPWVATQDAPCGENESLDGAMYAKGLDGILAASRRETASRWCQRGDKTLIEAYWCYQNPT